MLAEMPSMISIGSTSRRASYGVGFSHFRGMPIRPIFGQSMPRRQLRFDGLLARDIVSAEREGGDS